MGLVPELEISNFLSCHSDRVRLGGYRVKHFPAQISRKHVYPRYLLLLSPLNSHRSKIRSDHDFRPEISVPSDSQSSGEISEIGDHDTFSALHRLPSDELFHFYLGDPVKMLQLHPDGSSCVITLGPDLKAGQQPQAVVPRAVWQG